MRSARPLTVAALQAAAAEYVDRYAPNRKRLRTMLTRRIRKAGEGSDLAALQAAAERIVAEAVDRGRVDDAAWGASRARRMLSRGVAPAVVRQRLHAEAIPADRALAEAAEELGDPALVAARAYARRRRLGPWRVEARAEERDGDLAKLGRAGFPWAVARAVIDGEA